ncbi:peptidoglycan editing factor PgeF [candidate division WOR-3 bacterium]|nr:peptidoglycan editing factor PgeF [candidate division WOR-3 bacterium]
MKDAIEVATVNGAAFYTGTMDFSVKSLSEIYGSKNVFIPAKQIHSSKIAIVPDDDPNECDGILTKTPQIAICVQTADCLPLSLYDKKKRIIAVLHCGWRGIFSGIIEAGLEKMSDLGSEVETTIGVVHPHICSMCYEVKQDVASIFPKEAVLKSEDKLHLDLAGLVSTKLKDLGIERVIFSSLCTCHNPGLFHSYRRDGEKAGRIISWGIMT